MYLHWPLIWILNHCVNFIPIQRLYLNVSRILWIQCSKWIAWFSSIILLPSFGPNNSNFSKWYHSSLRWTGDLVIFKPSLPWHFTSILKKHFSFYLLIFFKIYFLLKVFLEPALVAHIFNLGILEMWALGSWLWGQPEIQSKSLTSLGYVCLYNMTPQNVFGGHHYSFKQEEDAKLCPASAIGGHW